jgi:competence protein ComEC
MGGAGFEVLWPPSSANRLRGLSDNERSLVLRVCHREICFLLTGDIEAQGEAGIESELSKRPSKVLKVAHHGSGTSSSEDFLNRLRPGWALISAGEGNRYRLPHPQVLKRLAASAQILRTDRMGQVEVETDGVEVSVRRFIDGPFPSRWTAIRAAVFGSGS